MKKTILSLLTLSLLSGAAARNHTDHIPAESLAVIRFHNLPEQNERIRNTPFGKAWESIDWPGVLHAVTAIMASGEEEDQASGEEFRRKLGQITLRLGQITPHFSGDFSLVIGDLAPFIRIMAENQERRTAFWENIDWDEEEGADIEKAMEQDMALDAKEHQALAQAFFLMADVKDGDALLENMSEWVRELLQEDSDAKTQLTRIEWQGATLYTVKKEKDEDSDEKADIQDVGMYWTVFDDILLITFSEPGIQEALNRLQNRPANRLSASLEFQAATEYLGTVDSLFYVNLPEIDRLIRLAIPADAPGFGTLTPDSLLRQLGLDSMASFSFGTRTTAEGMESRTRFGFQRESMLTRLFMTPVEDLKPAETPPFVHQGLSQAVSLHWSLARFYDALEKELATLSPEAAMGMGFARMAAGQHLGFDFKTGLLDHLDSGLIIAQEYDWELMTKLMKTTEDPDDFMAAMEARMEHPTGGTYYLIGLQLKNPQAVQSAVNTLLAKVFTDGLPDPELYREHPFIFPAAGMPQTPEALRRAFGYSFLDDYLLLSIGHPRMLQRAVDASQDAAQRLWTQPRYQDLRAKLPALSHGLDYNSSEAMREAYRFLFSLLENAAKEAEVTLPDLTPLTRIFGDAVGSTRRNGLILEQQGLIPFAESQ